MKIRGRILLTGLMLAAFPMVAEGQEFRWVAMKNRFTVPAGEKKPPSRPEAVRVAWEPGGQTAEGGSLMDMLPLRDSVSTKKTYFLTEDRLEVIHLWEGRLHLACFQQRMHFSPLRSAFPGLGASGLALRHESPLYTHSSTSYGMSISFHFGGSHGHDHRAPSRFSWFGR